MYYVYILESEKSGKYYIDSTSDLKQRISYHNKGINRSTKYGAPWKVVYKEQFPSKTSALTRERQIKKYKGGEAFKKLLS